MGTIKDIADSVRGNLIPQLYVLRRVPARYRRMLPLAIMKQFQCIVVGSAQGVLTVAITDRQNTAVIESLRSLTGQAIFPLFPPEAPVPGQFDHDATGVSENPV